MIQNRTIENAIKDILHSLGENPKRNGLIDTPKRVASMYQELFSGIDQDPYAELSVGFEEGLHDLIILKDIPFHSICEHHLIPFFGSANIAYLPNGKIAGISKLARALDVLAHRPQLQERLTSQIADTIHGALGADGVAALIKAEHLCMSIRGIHKPGTTVITSAIRGSFSSNSLSEGEILLMLGKH